MTSIKTPTLMPSAQPKHTNQLTDKLDRLESLTGNGTELITVLHPPDKDLSHLKQRLQTEYAEAEQIKSDPTRKNVQTALNRLNTLLTDYTTTPETGLALYAGVINDNLHSIVFDQSDLPRPINQSQYACDSTFDTAPVRNTLTPDEAYGLIVIERGAAIIGETDGERITPIQSFDSQVMGKTRAGGQSAARFARERERQLDEFFQTVASTANDQFIETDGSLGVEGLLIGGSLITAKAFKETTHLDHRLQNVVLGTFSVEYATEQGLTQLQHVGSDAIRSAEQSHRQNLLDEFFTRLTNEEPVAYGHENVRTAIEYGAVDTLLIATDLETELQNEFTAATQEYGGSVEQIPDSVEKGEILSNAFDGIGALLRFPIEN